MTSPQPVNNPSVVWTRFLVAFARLFQLPIREAAAYRSEAFLRWRDDVLNALASEETSRAISGAMQSMLDVPHSRLGAELMLGELDGFTDYVERLTGVPIDPDATYPEDGAQTFSLPDDPAVTRETFSIAGIIIDSLRDLMDKLPVGFKMALKAFSELSEMWREFG